jgi:hypothetical protein
MKLIDPDSIDKMLQDIADNGDELHLLSQAPSEYADVATYSLGYIGLVAGDGNGSYVIQDFPAGTRRLSLLGQLVPGTGEGTADHAVIIDTVNEKIKSVTTAPNYTMATGANQSVPGFDICEVGSPA